MRARFPVLILALCLAALAPSARAAAWMEVGGWTAACDNLRSCRVFGLAAPTLVGGRKEAEAYVLLDRSGAPDAAPQIAIKIHGSAGPRGSRWSLRVDGRRIGGFDVSGPSTIVLPHDPPGGNVWHIMFTEPGAAAFLEAIRAGKTIEIRRAGRSPIRISLDGAAATLGFVDARQGRVGATTALWAPGPAPESLPPLPPKPVVRRALTPPLDARRREMPASVLARLDPVNCPRAGDWSGRDDLIVPLGGGLTFFGPDCFTDQRWKVPQGFIGSDTGENITPVSLPLPPGDEDSGFKPVLWGRNFVPGQLVYFDWSFCGRSITWVWDGERFVVASARLVLDCKGVGEEDRFDYFTATLDPPLAQD